VRWQPMNKVTYLAKAFIFVARKHIVGLEVEPTPHFEPEGLAFFNSIILDTRTYLEYGSGGSTVQAAKHVKTLVSVESDPVFKLAVERKIAKESNAEIHLLSPYIGMTAHWGTPVFGRATPSRIHRWKRYPQAPWKVLKEAPDTILIDGRMRVACALESLLHVTRDTRMVVDDYVGREYQVIEDFADLIATHGIMAEFRKKKDFDPAMCQERLERYYTVLK